MSNPVTQTIYTIEVYRGRRWSDKYSSIYSTKEEAVETAIKLYKDYEYHSGRFNNHANPIHTCYRIKETIKITTIHEIQ
jgi:hypothetical protein